MTRKSPAHAAKTAAPAFSAVAALACTIFCREHGKQGS
eukprot:CAMPEP_0168421066 /NCGR_PEP_ID=MMETSP0228-20121227/33092_1 /TAXON_ID=133427 /ORGANISM="Protoceratium reticulatum, Strain CCCM 535 (=CCMP 1889)" /LENGTH=37 /DNA_ID= /DNA_START= /DNA_END= /DNA_ORIENTATION=